VKAAAQAELRLLTCGTYNNTVRWIPPVVVNAVEIDEGLGILEGVLDRTAA